ncbi:hypothetical protein CQA49_04645 [Helicobacter sp. MIT 00-7814]|uniref:hypothetical protein n=1 Tax=unclassified Helicobacter TaxID=2593540 RepID=UPI000E1EAE0C|nr:MULTISPECIES: hypothetical protein [unclassified Helicobacter]RDU54597.1 hypothetical protein CQA49_04645 [Helicobacter sp. MIT 00-7814]RDU54656.1 hypothetical protein CQA37_05130 [Helicobacter sp. MIT 99-10781]
MALPFLAGLILGGGAIIAYNNRKEIAKTLQAKTKDLREDLSQGAKKVRKNARELKEDLDFSVSVAKEAVEKVKSRRGRKPKNQTAQGAKKATKVKKPQENIAQEQTFLAQNDSQNTPNI